MGFGWVGGCEPRIEGIVQFKNKTKKETWCGCQGASVEGSGCDQRIEGFVQLKKKREGRGLRGWGSGGVGPGVSTNNPLRWRYLNPNTLKILRMLK